MKFLVALLLVALATVAAAKSFNYAPHHVAPFAYHPGYYGGYPGYHGYHGGFPHFGGVFVYYGAYPGQCGADGLYYKDADSFIVCSNGNAYYQRCAPGSQNSGNQHYGAYVGYTDFCDVNLNSVVH